MKTKAKKKANYSGGRYKIACPNCGERDVTKMVTGQRSAYAECHCGCCFDVETGLGIQRRINVGRDRRTVYE